MYVRPRGERVQTRHLTRQNERPHDTSGSERVGEHIEADAAGETGPGQDSTTTRVSRPLLAAFAHNFETLH